jgi:hypothetical protein
MKTKTSELQGSALDWVVAKCLPDDTARIYFDEQTGEKLFLDDWEVPEFSPSIDWAQGGPIIERDIAKIERFSEALWEATAYTKNAQDIVQSGPNPLVAAMRCYVASQLGDEVELPEELVGVKLCS